MKKINKEKLITLTKSYLYPAVLLLLAGALIYQAFFVYSRLQEKAIDETALTAREEKINETGYNTVIQKDNSKKEVKADLFERVNNPF